MTRINPARLPALCRERAEGYGDLRANSMTAIALDEAAGRIEELEGACKDANEDIGRALERIEVLEAALRRIEGMQDGEQAWFARDVARTALAA